ncbi:MAG: hypothetical protein F4160_15325 [Rhodospirillaceae bacterium]|nr:hypothetical protein [Rhodospirillaceae bacterium]MYH38159.1 hypothetical protein [Rhodospirillaceae bacterium]MYK14782.1 hypothetical protein [Rhodospirillaceae bacterium]
MKARIVRFDAHYEVAFSRPAFSRIASFSQIMEPIYDAFSPELIIPSDAISFESGNTIATAGVTLTLFSGLNVFEAKLDGYMAHFLDLRSPDAIDRAKRHAKLFEDAVCGFLIDGVPAHSKLVTSSWLTVEGGVAAAEALVRRLTWLPDSDDPFQIEAANTRSIVKFECFNKDELWKMGITIEKSALPEADLFLELSGDYASDSYFDSIDNKADHISAISLAVVDKLGLIVE